VKVFIDYCENVIIGKDDAVFCFFCGMGLKEWEKGDTAWGEHARWSPDCTYVNDVKGQEFIEMERLRDTNPEEVNTIMYSKERQCIYLIAVYRGP
jgi:hypothetical protein